MLDVSVAYNRFRFLGLEFLTWLWFSIATGTYKKKVPFESNAIITIGDRMVLENRNTSDLELITIKGDGADLKEGMVALAKGALVAELAIIYHSNAQTWHFTIKGENLGLTNVKTPVTGPSNETEDLEGALLEKIYLYETVFDVTNMLYERYIKERINGNWNNGFQTAVKKWLTTSDDKG